jgi:menaquinol-cytochrome c reductase iron-sulfur subunit
MAATEAQAGSSPAPERAPDPPRRSFFRFITGAVSVAAGVLAGAPLLVYVLRPRQTPVDWVGLGAVGEFPLNETRRVTFDNPLRQPWDGMVARATVFVRYEGKDSAGKDQFLVLDVNCAHLGCPVTWFPESALFMCPCHGGAYYSDGSRASGPPPRGLYSCVWRVESDRLEIQAPHYPTLQNTLTKSTEVGDCSAQAASSKIA